MILQRALRSALTLLAALLLFAMPVQQARAVITFQSAGAVTNSSIISINPAYPAAVAAGDLLVLIVGMKPSVANSGSVTTPEGWTLVTSLTGAGGYGVALAADTGNTNVFAYYKVAEGNETGSLRVRLTTNNVAWAQMYRLTNATQDWSVVGTTGSDTVGGAGVSITMGAIGVATGDFILGAMVIPTDASSFSMQGFAQAGATFSAAVELSENESTIGNDIGGFVARSSVTAGSSAAAPTMAATAAATNTDVRGPGIFIRVRATGAITYQSAGAADFIGATLATSVCPVHPAAVAAGDLLVTLIGMKPSVANGGAVTTPSGWTAVSGGSLTGAGGYGVTLGADTGNTNVFSFYRVATGTEASERCFALATNNVSWAQMYRYSSTTQTWLVAGTTGSDASGTAPNDDVSIAMSSNPGVTAGDHILGAMVIPTDATSGAQFTAETFSQTGALFSAAVEISEPFSTTGNDIGGFVARSSVTAGVGGANPTLTAAAASASANNVRGPGVFIRIRDEAAFTMAAFRFYEDGTEAGSTTIAAQNTSIIRDVTPGNSNLQLRLRIQEINTLSGVATDDYQIQYSKNGGAYTDITGASANVQAFASGSLTNGGATTTRLTGGSGAFVAGEASTDGVVNDAQLTASNHTEHLYAVTLIAADLANNDTLDFRVMRNGAVIARYAVAPRITVSKVVPGSFNAFESGTLPALAIGGVITTRRAGTGFSLDVVAISGGVQQTAFTSPVTVELLGNNTLGVALDAQNCPSTFVLQQASSPANPTIAAGRSTVSFAAVANSFRDVRVRISWPTASPTVIWCSTDNFAIRPDTLASFAVTDTDWETTGAPGVRPLDLLTFAATTPIHKAGRPFSVRATAVNTAAVTTGNYIGAPTAALSACAGAACTATFGALTLATTFVAGQLASDTASYDNVGSFRVRLEDTDFASVDTADTAGDCTAAGRYVCSASLDVGRFVPDHFVVTLTTPEFGPACAPFTYVGQSFNYAVPPVITVRARNFGNTDATLYTDNTKWWRITNAVLDDKTYTSAPATLNTGGTPGTDPAIADLTGGVGTLSFSSGTGFFYTRTTPTAPFNAEIGLSISVKDADGVTYGSNPVQFGAASTGLGIAFTGGGKSMRFGRLRLQGSSSNVLLPARLPLSAEHWTGTGFTTNTADSCTALAPANVGYSLYAGKLQAGEVGAPTVVTDTSSGGKWWVVVPKPSGGDSMYEGSVLVTPDLTAAGLLYLKGNWTGGGFTADPSARATFGFYSVQPKQYIFFRENY